MCLNTISSSWHYPLHSCTKVSRVKYPQLSIVLYRLRNFHVYFSLFVRVQLPRKACLLKSCFYFDRSVYEFANLIIPTTQSSSRAPFNPTSSPCMVYFIFNHYLTVVNPGRETYPLNLVTVLRDYDEDENYEKQPDYFNLHTY